MTTKRTYYRETTAQQRKLLFEIWEATGSVIRACQKAHVCRGTFYYWKRRFEEQGYAGLEAFASRAPKRPHQTAPEIEEEVIAARREHPEWGKRRIADELAKANNWVPLVSPNTVRRILKDAGLWESNESGAEKRRAKATLRTAEQPGQAVNIDLCFVPVTHEQAEGIPAVSGSSGRLRVQRAPAGPGERTWPGRVFEDQTLTYEEAMLGFVAASQERADQAKAERQSERTGRAAERAAKRDLDSEERQLRDARRRVREKRKLEDAAWREFRAQRKAAVQAYQALCKEARHQQLEAKQAQDAQWRVAWAQRQDLMSIRQAEDDAWREARRLFRERWAELPASTLWMAILVVIDNCTRQCLGLPLFVAGAKVTAEVVAEALYVLLPPELRFLISDRGTHFRAGAFKKRILSETFIHVYTARHRPQSNSIAERFIRTLKEWLETKSWTGDQELEALLQQFHAEYNDRPHQGLAIPGLSPNEFAKRIWLM